MSIKKYYNLGKKNPLSLLTEALQAMVKKDLKIIKNEFSELKIKRLNLEKKFSIGKFPMSGILMMRISRINLEKNY